MLTIGAVKAATPQARAYKLFDAGGLHLHVAPTGCRSWRLKYRHGGREKLLTFGRFPEISLPEARAMRETAKAALREGRDPAAPVYATDRTFYATACAWHALRAPGWSTTHAADVLASLARDVFPAIGAMPIAAITPPDVLSAVRAVEARGQCETARRIRQRIGAIFGYAMSEGWCTTNPAATTARAMLPPKLTQPHPALTEIESCRDLLTACDHIAGPNNMVALASRFLALTAVRLDAVRGMRWEEIELIDSRPVWRVPPDRMKLARSKKQDARFAHLVPLSAAAIAVLDRVEALERGARCALVFPGAGGSGPMGERAIGNLYLRAGFAGRHVPHGWRASFSTIMNELMPEHRDAIDLALAHAGKGKVEGAYNRAQLLGQRRALFDRWGELLTGEYSKE
ncbi:integrase arm-type DNA-binding domain-containing protein [Novosphingobium sp. FSW06-99]|uniref:tyrosine-type recombinase/integrase n=1 Tax=Novosphingobium sp. FSW06-99 TaxID=1739113 RepID=UPI00076CEC94|nr:integrase arm-type DNA-binding domain-containing protein [Novosphingobium sp. FSW06-99]KUR80732.1 integrase [Novosphingobium sp. FSW06-99]